MVFSGKKILRISAALAFIFCMLFANFYAVRLMLRYGVEVYFYDKLLVAYDIGGKGAFKLELEKIRAGDKNRRETMLADDLATRPEALKEPADFLNDKVRRGKKMVHFIRDMRSAAIILMIVIFFWQMAVKSSFFRKRRKV